MTCASCAGRIEKALKTVPGVESASINLLTEKATVRARRDIAFGALSAAVENAGYDMRAKAPRCRFQE